MPNQFSQDSMTRQVVSFLNSHPNTAFRVERIVRELQIPPHDVKSLRTILSRLVKDQRIIKGPVRGVYIGMRNG